MGKASRGAECGSRGAPASLPSQGPLPRSSKREKRMNRSSRRGLRAPAGRRGAAAAGTITRTSVVRTGGPLRPRCRSPPRRHPQLRNNSCRERVRLRASEGQGRRSAPTAGLQRELRRPGTSRSFACIRAPCRRPREHGVALDPGCREREPSTPLPRKDFPKRNSP